jgi:ParB family chromosome partitioning protein
MKSDSVDFIPLEQIEVGERLRPVDNDAIALIAGSMSYPNNGQLTPIKVRRLTEGNYRLVAGAHRLAAAKLLKLHAIRAEIFEGTAEDALMCEIDENLCRTELSAADQAIFLQRKLELFEVEGGKLRRGRDLRKSAKLAHLDPEEKKRFYKTVERQIGVPRRIEGTQR